MTKADFTIEVAPYGWRLFLLKDRATFESFRESRGMAPLIRDTSKCVGFCSTNFEQQEVYVGVFTGEASVLVHELIHACTNILEDVGIPLTGEASEAMAYLMGHLYEHCSIALKAKGKKRR